MTVCENAEISRITASLRYDILPLPRFMAIYPTLPLQFNPHLSPTLTYQ